MIHSAVGSTLFQSFYAIGASGQEEDVLQQGHLACASVVSKILLTHGLIGGPHATVDSTITDMLASGWAKTDKPVPGSVVHWPANGNGHEHIGFYLDEHSAMSNSTQQGIPVIHGVNMPDGREPIAYYTHPKLSQ